MATYCNPIVHTYVCYAKQNADAMVDYSSRTCSKFVEHY